MNLKIKKIMGILLATIIVFGLLTSCNNNPPSSNSNAEKQINELEIADSWKQELLLAAYMGLPMDNAKNETISGSEMANLLDSLVKYEAPDKLSEWKSMYTAFRAYKEPLQRIDVQSILFLAIQFIGEPYTDYVLTFNSVNMDQVNASMRETNCPTWELYGNVNEFDNGEFGTDHFGVAGTFYNNISTSPVSCEQPLSYDSQKNSYHMRDKASYLDGLLAIARAAAVVHTDMFAYIPTNEEQSIFDSVEARRNSIKNSESDWTVGEGGTIYYVSPNGNDNNDGLTPETAWQTLGKINSAAIGDINCRIEDINAKEFPQYQWATEHPSECITLKSGDVVLFERDGLWRGGLITAEGVTYSSYGEGAKPEIWGSPENGSGAEKWSLLEGTNNIWVYYKEIQECGGILLNGERVAQKCTPVWDADNKRWIDFGDDAVLPINEALARPDFKVTTLENLNFFNELQNITPAFPAWCWGKLYLRCDNGNPGKIYDSIEFFSNVDAWGRCVQVAKYAVLDNLSFKYFGSSVNLADNATVNNCWIEYCGGIVQEYNKGGYVTTTNDNDIMGLIRCGECITAGNSNTTVTNTYIAYAYDHGLSVENGAAGWMEDPTQDYVHRNVNVSGNLLEYNAGGLNCICWDALAAGLDVKLFEDIYFTDNYVMYTGMGWSHPEHYTQGYTYLSSAVIGVNPGNEGEIHVTNNIFYDCWNIGQLVHYEFFDSNVKSAIFDKNLYVANAGSRVAEASSSSKRNSGVEQILHAYVYASDDWHQELDKYLKDTNAVTITRHLTFVSPK